MHLLIGADQLRAQLGTPELRVIDVRWYLAEPARGRAEYEAGHILGAVHLDINADLSGPKGSGPGRHPLPSAAAFTQTMQRAGVSAKSHVVAYDSSGGAAAARLWWLLRYYGHQHVMLLDGGWPAWVAAGGPTHIGETVAVPGDFRAQSDPDLVVDADDVEDLRHHRGALLLDARAAERYRGEIEPIDAQAGHIPGARSAPFAGNLAPDGTFLSPAQLRDRYAALGVGRAAPVVCYCGSGVTACHNLFALELAGYPGAQLYPGSWSDWSSQPDRPVATEDGYER